MIMDFAQKKFEKNMRECLHSSKITSTFAPHLRDNA